MSQSNQGWQYVSSTCVNFCPRNGLLKLEVEEGAGRHVGLYPTALIWTEQNRWARSCFVTLPFPQKWNTVHFWKSGGKGKDIIQRWLELRVLVYFLQRQNTWSLLQAEDFFSLPLSCATPSDSVTLRVGVLPQQGLPIGTAGLLKHVKPRMCCLVEAQVEWKARGEAPERRHYLPLCALLFRVHSSEPQTCTMVLHWALWLGLS